MTREKTDTGSIARLDGIVVIVGNYGSGKTEVALNLAFERAGGRDRVSIVDLDLVNPYFRTREIRGLLKSAGVTAILPEEGLLNADLPILSPRVLGALRKNEGLTICDVGGNDAGATVMASLADALKGKTPRVLQVVNPFRPFTETIQGCVTMKSQIENASRLKVDAWVGNPNLMELTEAKHLWQGYEFMAKLSEKTGMAVEFVTAPVKLLDEMDPSRILFPVLGFTRRLSFPWNGKNSL